MELNTDKIGKIYEPDFWDATKEELKSFAAGYNDFDNPAFNSGEVSPPMYVSRYTAASMFRVLLDGELNINMGRLVHGDHEVSWHRLARPGEKLRTVASVAAMEEKSSGEIIRAKYDTFSGDELLSTTIASFFIKGKSRGEKKTEAAPPPPPPRPPVAFTQRMYVTNDQTWRYAEGSGDFNLIHVNEEFAKSVGLPGVILQGLCTMAFGSKAIMDCLCGKDPSKLKKYFVRFSKPVRPWDILTTEGWIIEEQPGKKIVGLEIKNQDGVIVISNGRAEIEA